MEKVDLLIAGGGAAGLSAAKAAYGAGCNSILVADRGKRPGGVLLQCAHRGFAINMNGIEYADSILRDFPPEIGLAMNTTVISVSNDHTAVLSSPEDGIRTVAFEYLILASGCLEIPIGALSIGGTRPSGIYTAGTMQAMMNLDGYVPEGPVVILGSGDLGLIIADQIAKIGVEVTIVEKKSVCGGMARNRKRIETGKIQLILGKTIREVIGYPRISGVLLSDGSKLECKTLLTAVGLRPDTQLLSGVDLNGRVRFCGNCRKVCSMIEAVIADGEALGKSIARRIREEL